MPIVDLLLRAGADVNHVDDEGFTPLISASTGGSLAVVQRFVEAGADLGTITRTCSYTPLKRAAEHGYLDIVKYFLDQGVKADQFPETGTALTIACENGELDVARALLEVGADPTLSVDGETAIDLAREFGHPKIVSLLTAPTKDVRPQSAQ